MSEDIRLTYHVHGARDLRETRVCIIDTALENKTINNHPTTNTAYVSQYSDIRARWLKHVHRQLDIVISLLDK